MNDTCNTELTDLTKPASIAYVEVIEETLQKTLKPKMSQLVRVKVSKIECGSVIATVDLYFPVDTVPGNTSKIMDNAVSNDEFPRSLKVMKSGVKMNAVDRCNVGKNPCGEHGKCLAIAYFKHTCLCDDGYDTEAGVCKREEADDDLALKVYIANPLSYRPFHPCAYLIGKKEVGRK